ncbi:MAG: iron-containing alcohol dehydrogenase [Spirochaetales bacterium]|jgi:alcohol dehydrogenase class IV|nr:iron-containing alcohol dehydrogenase [Spirochaetales bacterium]
MAELSFSFPGKIFFGSDVLNLLGSLTASFGMRTMLIADGVLHDGRHIERIQDVLRKKGIDCLLLDDVNAPGSRRSIQDVVDFAKASRTQVFLGLGGTSILNTTRKTACLASTQKNREGLPVPLPYIEIPTVFRSPYMVTDAYVDTDPITRRPVLVSSAEGLSKAILVDPSLTAGLPPKFMGTLMLDTLLLAVEGYLSANANFFSDAHFFAAINLLGEGIGEAIRGVKDLRPRVKASQAGVLCAFGITATGLGVGSILSLALHTLFGVPKSWAAAILLPHMLDILAESRTERMAAAAKILGEDVFGLETGAAARLVPSWTRRIIAQMFLPGRLRDLNLKLNELIDAAEAAAEFDVTSRIPMTIDGLYDLLKRAY